MPLFVQTNSTFSQEMLEKFKHILLQLVEADAEGKAPLEREWMR
jgi:hypothetical protein